MLTLDQANALMFRSYERAGQALQGLDQHTRDLTAMRDLNQRVQALPDPRPPVAITVTGSKGKGSTALLCAAVLQACGHTVGLLTSPHMLDVRERIRVNGVQIPEDAYTAIIADLAPPIAALDAALPPGKYLSPTGLFLLVAARWFQQRGCTAVVLEVGRGGRYDDVSLYPNHTSVFTPITGEHLDRLGPAVADVAWHKAGIIKRGGITVCAPQPSDAQARITDEARALDNTLLLAESDFAWTSQTSNGVLSVTLRERGSDPVTLHLPTPAAYQAINLSVAYTAALHSQRAAGLPVADPAAINAQLGRLLLPGRCQRVSTTPAVWVDGAIHRDAARLFRQSVEGQIRRPLVLVTALPDDKDTRGVLDTLAPLADQVLVTQLNAKHLHFSPATLNLARAANPHTEAAPSPEAAFARGLEAAGPSGTLWVVGTQSLVREALRFWHHDLSTLISPTMLYNESDLSVAEVLMSRTILYIDDDVLQLKMIERMLSREGFRILTAADGSAGVRIALEQTPDLILLDVNMPNVDGLEVTSLLKTATHTRFIPVVALTANVLPGDRERILAGGFDAYLAKPVTRSELLEMINQFGSRSTV